MGSGSLLLKCAVSPLLLSFLCEDSFCSSFLLSLATDMQLKISC